MANIRLFYYVLTR